jgi:hypothetical protein
MAEPHPKKRAQKVMFGKNLKTLLQYLKEKSARNVTCYEIQ